MRELRIINLADRGAGSADTYTHAFSANGVELIGDERPNGHSAHDALLSWMAQSALFVASGETAASMVGMRKGMHA